MVPLKVQLKSFVFWIKWLATFSALTTVYLTSHDIIPLNKYFGLWTAFLWMILGICWREPSMWVLNVIMMMLYLKGILFI